MKIDKRTNVFLFVISGILLFCFCFLLVSVKLNLVDKLDIRFAEKIASIRSSGLTKFMKAFTHLGSFAWLLTDAVIASVLLIFVFKKRKLGILLISNLLVSGIISTIIKYTVRRSRPSGMLINEIGYSFPSAHAMLTFAVFGMAIYVFWKLLDKKWAKYLLLVLFSAIILSVGFTRLYLGVHYLSDVIAGYILASIITIISVIVAGKIENHWIKKKNE